MVTPSVHKTPKRFYIEGTLKDDADIPRLRDQYERILVEDMREQGYLLSFDLGPIWSTNFNDQKEQYEFVLSMYGIYVGVKAVIEYSGYDGRGSLYRKG